MTTYFFELVCHLSPLSLSLPASTASSSSCHFSAYLSSVAPNQNVFFDRAIQVHIPASNMLETLNKQKRSTEMICPVVLNHLILLDYNISRLIQSV